MRMQLLYALLAPTGLALFGCYFAAKFSKRINQPDVIEDPEFTGFKLRPVTPYTTRSNATNQYCLLPTDIAIYADEARRLLDDCLQPVDVIVASYPKSGTTWLSEVVFLLTNKLDWEAARTQNLEERVPYFEYISPGPKEIMRRPAPRVIKTHLPFTYLPSTVQLGQAARIIYITRDPRDVAVSYYYFARSFVPAGYKHREGIHGFAERFLHDRLPYSPWSMHVQSYVSAYASRYQSESNPKILIVQYEDLKSDPMNVVRQVEQFLRDTWISDKLAKPPALSEQEITQVIEHCSFKAMLSNPQTNYSWLEEHGLWVPYSRFLRKGTVGDHKRYMTEADSQAIKQMAIDAGLMWTLSSNK